MNGIMRIALPMLGIGTVATVSAVAIANRPVASAPGSSEPTDDPGSVSSAIQREPGPLKPQDGEWDPIISSDDPVLASDAGTPTSQVVDGIMELYDANSDGTIKYAEGGKHGVTGEAMRQARGMHQTPHGPLLRTFDTITIESLVAAADGLDGAVSGEVSRLDLMTVAGAFDVTGGDNASLGTHNDHHLNDEERKGFERLFRERIVDSRPLSEVIRGPR